MPWLPTRNPHTTCARAFSGRTELTIDSHNTKPVADDYPARLYMPDHGRPATSQIEGTLDDEPKLLIVRRPISHPTIMYCGEPIAGLPLRVFETERSAAIQDVGPCELLSALK